MASAKPPPSKQEVIIWAKKVKQVLPKFLCTLRGQETPGFFHYALSGDLYSEKEKWGVGNTVFAVKIYHILNLLISLPQNEKREMAQFILNFQNLDGEICDPLIHKKAWLSNLVQAFRNFSFANLMGQQTRAAETRQALSALFLLGKKPPIPYRNFPQTKKQVLKYLHRLPWHKPWHAASHFSHLLFFLQHSNLSNKKALIILALRWMARLQHQSDGVWYIGKPNKQERINGAMKVISGFQAVGFTKIRHTQKLINLCLTSQNGRQACDNLNILYVIRHCQQGAYRQADIENFTLRQMSNFQKYYFPEHGGFSFLPRKANIFYYGARLARGLPEPDLHGTLMFLWGLSLCAQLLKINQRLGFNELIS